MIIKTILKVMLAQNRLSDVVHPSTENWHYMALHGFTIEKAYFSLSGY